MSGLGSLIRTSIGKKVVMALSGVVWLGYVVGHLLGNLLVFRGPEAINSYSEFLHHSPGILWPTRALLLVALAAHVVTSAELTLSNVSARPVGYAKKVNAATSAAAKTMIWTGPLLFFFILYHLAHLTLGVAPGAPYDPANVYNNVVYGFRIWWLVALYVVAQLCLGMHLYHGAWSWLQTLGVNHPEYNPLRRQVAVAASVLIVVGFLSIPLAVAAGFLEPAPTETAVAYPHP
jgi:succinate dehydrogenase / fumarate reductase cytochrome b subunit